MIIRTYFKTGGRLIKVEVPTDSVGIALVEAQLCAAESNVTPDSPVFAIVDGGRAA